MNSFTGNGSLDGDTPSVNGGKMFASSLGSKGNDGDGGNRFFQMLVGEGNKGSAPTPSVSIGTTQDNSFDLNDFPSLGPITSGFHNDKSQGGGAPTGTDFAAALSRAATGHTISDNGSGNIANMGISGLVSSRDADGGVASLRALVQEGGSSSGTRISSLAGLNDWSINPSSSDRFEMAKEDFPALPGAVPRGIVDSKYSSSISTSASIGTGTLAGFSASGGGGGNGLLPGTTTILPASNPQQEQSKSRGFALLNPLGPASSEPLSSHPSGASSAYPKQSPSNKSSTAPTPGSSSAKDATGSTGNTLGGEYGLLGLLSVIRVSDVDHNALALGSDLTLLGLNLSSSEPLYKSFEGPFAPHKKIETRLEPVYQIPSCYFIPSTPALKTGHLSKFQVETLFYIFHAFTQDVLQAHAAQELYSRNWKYHGDLKLWFTTTSKTTVVVSEDTQSPNSQSQLIYFDTYTWEKRLYSSLAFEQQSNANGSNGVTNVTDLSLGTISSGFLSDQDVKVSVSKQR